MEKEVDLLVMHLKERYLQSMLPLLLLVLLLFALLPLPVSVRMMVG